MRERGVCALDVDVEVEDEEGRELLDKRLGGGGTGVELTV